MEKINIAPFCVGDKVVYIGATEDGLISKKTYIVEGINFNCCGWAVDVGGFKHFISKISAYCFDCGRLRSDNWCVSDKSPYTTWFSHTEFRKISEQSMKKLTFEQIQKEEKEEVLQLN